ncbi:AAA family ATPase [Nocardia amikacinitolerans]|uniref:AAA family ATPase n=1 Tax=Nocardia amikacinitolerans TaxID=756689 RepID=UPI0020A38C0B|nr:AAA family ATPase [Nocardia amikacinitolerans]MCP2280234.1 regulatory protein, luxR family [Nocardia amikacinitolerans]
MVERAFVGRRAELAALDDALESPDGPWVLLVDGQAGIGKSRLLAALAPAAARRGLRVLSVTATEDEQPQPSHVIHDVLERLADAGAEVTDVPSDGDGNRLGRALRRHLAATGTLLVVDDAHWLDAESVRTLTYLVRNRPAPTFRLLLAYRSGQCPVALTRVLTATGAATRTVRVPPFTGADVAALLPDTTAARRDRLLAASRGNPLYLLLLADLPDHEVERAVSGEDPAEGDYPGLDRTLRAELAQLPDRERLVAQAIALCGAHADLEMLCATSELPIDAVTAALDELSRRALVEVAGSSVTFGHPLIRTAAHRLAGTGWRAAAHRRAATLLRQRGAALPALAHHLELGLLGTDPVAAAELKGAAAQVLPSSPATSARWIAAALRATPGGRPEPPEDRLLLGRALLLSGAGARARETLEPLIARPGAYRLEALLLSARCERMLGRVDRARALLAAAADLPLLPGDGPVQLELAILELQDGQDAEGHARLDALFASDAIADPAVRASATALRCLGAVAEPRIDSARAGFEQADLEFERLDDDRLREVVHATPALGWAAYFLDTHTRGLAQLDRAVGVSRRFGRSYALAELHTVRAYCLMKLGRVGEALAAAEDADDLARQFGYGDLIPFAGALKLRALQLVTAREDVLRQWAALNEQPRPVMRWWRQVVETTLHEVGVRLGVIEPGLPPLTDNRPGPMQPTQLARYANLALADGDHAAAGELVTRAEAAAARLGLPSQLAAASLARAEYCCAIDDLESAEAAATACVEWFDQADMPVDRARAVLLGAQIAGQRGDFALATQRLVRARETFAAAGATQLVAATTSLQRRLAGGRAPGGATALTAREREVAELAARGHPNKEIAHRLYLSPRTVEDHLGRILRKLELSGRAGIAHKLGELDRG